MLLAVRVLVRELLAGTVPLEVPESVELEVAVVVAVIDAVSVDEGVMVCVIVVLPLWLRDFVAVIWR